MNDRLKNIILIFITMFVHTSLVRAQDNQTSAPKVEVRGDMTNWYGVSIDTLVGKSDLIFEGRILTDSAFLLPAAGHIFTLHQVLVLKKFWGNFTSDTVRVVTWGGKVRIKGEWEKTPYEYAFTGDEAVIFATNSTRVYLGGNDPTTYDPYYGPGASYITVCDKKDAVAEVYQPIEKVTGQRYTELRPNTCKEWREAQKKKPVPRVPLGSDGKPKE